MSLTDFIKQMQKFQTEVFKVQKQVLKKLQKALDVDAVPSHKFVSVRENEPVYGIEVQLYPRNYLIRFLPARARDEVSFEAQILQISGDKAGPPCGSVTVGPNPSADEVYAGFEAFIDGHWPR